MPVVIDKTTTAQVCLLPAELSGRNTFMYQRQVVATQTGARLFGHGYEVVIMGNDDEKSSACEPVVSMPSFAELQQLVVEPPKEWLDEDWTSYNQ